MRGLLRGGLARHRHDVGRPREGSHHAPGSLQGVQHLHHRAAGVNPAAGCTTGGVGWQDLLFVGCLAPPRQAGHSRLTPQGRGSSPAMCMARTVRAPASTRTRGRDPALAWQYHWLDSCVCAAFSSRRLACSWCVRSATARCCRDRPACVTCAHGAHVSARTRRGSQATGLVPAAAARPRLQRSGDQF